MKFLLLIVLVNFVWASSNPSDTPNADDCAPFMEVASNDLRNCLGRNPDYDLNAITQKFNETFMQETNKYDEQKHLVQVSCDFVQMVVECVRNYRNAVPTTCLDPNLLAAEILHEEFQIKLHKYFCMDGLKNALNIVKNDGVRTFFRSSFLSQCITPAGDLSPYLLENDQSGRNPEFCPNSKKAFDCLHELFETSPNQNINTVLSETYAIVHDIMNCDNEL